MATQVARLAHQPAFKLGTMKVEPAHVLARGADGKECKLEPRVMQVLVELAQANGAILSRADLRDSCWEGRVTSDDAIDRVIAQIRRLSAGVGANSFAVETVPKVGYRLIELPADGRSARASGLSRRFLIGGSIAALGGAATGFALYKRIGRPAPRSRDAPMTIAVLPFTSEAPSPQLETLAAELSDEVRSDVSRVVEIRVIAQTSSRNAANEGRTAQQVGNSLGADYIVEGQLGSVNGQIVTSIALVDSANGSQVWAVQESAPARDPTQLRPEISGDVIQHLAGIIPISTQNLPPIRRPDPEAYALVQQANRLLEAVRTNEMRGRRGDALDLGNQAQALVQRALAIDPNYSGALATLATITRNGWTTALARQNLTTKQRVQASIDIVRRALVADPRDPAALTELGDYDRRFEFRWDEAENLFRRALAIDPSFVEAHWSYGYELGTLGRAIEGLDHALSVYELDPRNPFHRVALPRLLYLLGDRAGAMRRYQAELREQPDNLFLLRELYFIFLSEGNAPDLAKLGARVADRPTTPELSDLAAHIDGGYRALRGRPEKLRSLVDIEVAGFDRPDAASNATPQGRARDDLPYIFAIEYAWAGVPEKSIDMLDRALAAKSLYWPPTLPFGIAPFPRAVRANPRYQSLWLRDPGLMQLVRSRRAAVLSGQMAGFTPDGRRVVPNIPQPLVGRVEAALKGGE